MTWIMLIVLMNAPYLAENPTSGQYTTEIGPFKSEASCVNAKAIISEDVKNAKFYCFQVEKE